MWPCIDEYLGTNAVIYIYVLSCIRCVPAQAQVFKQMYDVYVPPSISLSHSLLIDFTAACIHPQTTVLSITLMNGFDSHLLGSAGGWWLRTSAYVRAILAPACVCPHGAVVNL